MYSMYGDINVQDLKLPFNSNEYEIPGNVPYIFNSFVAELDW